MCNFVIKYFRMILKYYFFYQFLKKNLTLLTYTYIWKEREKERKRNVFMNWTQSLFQKCSERDWNLGPFLENERELN